MVYPRTGRRSSISGPMQNTFWHLTNRIEYSYFVRKCQCPSDNDQASKLADFVVLWAINLHDRYTFSGCRLRA